MNETRLYIRFKSEQDLNGSNAPWRASKLNALVQSMQGATGGYANNYGESEAEGGGYFVRLYVPLMAGLFFSADPKAFQEALLSEWYVERFAVTDITIEEAK